MIPSLMNTILQLSVDHTESPTIFPQTPISWTSEYIETYTVSN